MAYAPHTLSPGELAAVFEAERAGVPFLSFRDAHRDLRIVPLTGDSIAIGRAAGNDVVLGWDRAVSRTHVALERVGAAWVVVDGGLSRNGCTVNAEPLHGRRRLVDYDVLGIGATSLAFRSSATADASTIAANAATLARVTEAERRVLVSLCRPLLAQSGAPPASNGEIGDDLCISGASVKTHLRSLFAKLEIAALPQNQKRAALARRALEAGLVSVRDLSRP